MREKIYDCTNFYMCKYLLNSYKVKIVLSIHGKWTTDYYKYKLNKKNEKSK